MAKPLRKALTRLQQRTIAFNNAPYKEEGPFKRKASGGYHAPGSMNAHKSHSIKRTR